VGAKRWKVEADLGPVKYLATLLGAKDDERALVFHLESRYCSIWPAVLLLLVATRTARAQLSAPEAQRSVCKRAVERAEPIQRSWFRAATRWQLRWRPRPRPGDQPCDLPQGGIPATEGPVSSRPFLFIRRHNPIRDLIFTI
jgi:hypothetical protein